MARVGGDAIGVDDPAVSRIVAFRKRLRLS